MKFCRFNDILINLMRRKKEHVPITKKKQTATQENEKEVPMNVGKVSM
jgi:hypothetical protein